jgi:DNA-binding NtrC family response regulator
MDPADPALAALVAGTASETGARFFAVLVENLSRALGTKGAWVTDYLEDAGRLRSFALWIDGKHVPDYEYDVAGSPCETVVRENRAVHIPERVLDLYPADPELRRFGAVSYLGVPLADPEGKVLGHLAVLDSRPMPEDPRALSLMRIFASRATAEILRLRGEADFRRLVDGAVDAILQLDRGYAVRRMNPAARRMLGTPRTLDELIEASDREKIARLAAGLPDGGGTWVVGGLRARHPDGKAFASEATLSRSGSSLILILRDVNDRLEAERQILALRQEVSDLRGADGLLGESPAMRRVLDDVRQVAGTGASVLLLGETGTGKELVARAVHQASARHGRPFVKLNCAAIPASLVESELFGHEKGAFTGATARREGRFALADGGSIFLDEVGELPLDLQPKLLRVLQEGEFEPVGSGQTRKVDVRVLAATNRDLLKEAREGRFREDLYYRLCVFPLQLPRLRDRGDDVLLLAEHFTEIQARKLGHRFLPLSEADRRRLRAYDWPGNVRELQNVIERAAITSRGEVLNLDRALPEAPSAAPTAEPGRVLSGAELADLERENLRRALRDCGGRVEGEGGAARLLGLSPSTLRSRMKALGIPKNG